MTTNWDLLRVQASRPNSNIGIHLLTINCNIISSEASLPIFPNNGGPIKRTLCVIQTYFERSRLDLTRITPKYLSSETQVIITPVALVMVEQFMSYLEPIRKQQDLLEFIVKSKACSSHSITFYNSCSLFTVGDSIKISSAYKNTKIPGMCLLMLTN